MQKYTPATAAGATAAAMATAAVAATALTTSTLYPHFPGLELLAYIIISSS